MTRLKSFLRTSVEFAAMPGDCSLFWIHLFSRHLIVFCFALLFAASARAAPIHAHCKVEPWGLTFAIEDFTGLSLNGGFDIMPVIPIPGPGNDTDTCKYELSDFSRVDLALTFSGTTLLTVPTFGFSVGGNKYATTSTNSTATVPLFAAFMSDVQTTLFFAQHNSDGFIGGLGTDESPRLASTRETSLFFPLNFITVGYPAIADPPADYRITRASISLTGKHYFLEVPEPTPICLLGIALTAIVLTNPIGRNRSIVGRK